MGGRVWLFDLDNTLHDASRHILPRINRAMTSYVARHLGLDEAAASALRQHYWHRYGATLLGLLRHHDVDPDHFLRETHRFADLAALVVRQPALRHVLRRLPGRKIVFSNAPAHYAEAVLEVMGVRPLFDAVCGIECLRLRPKPQLHAFLHLMRRQRLAPARCVLVDDSVENLRVAKRLGMRTVWISRPARTPAWVDLRLKSVLELPRRMGTLG